MSKTIAPAFDISTPPPPPGESLRIPLAAIPDWLERHGYVVMGYDPRRGFIIKPKNDMAKLNDILTEMLSAANASPGTPVRRELGNGLRLGLMAAGGGYKFQISRGGKVWPGKTEWKTLRRAMPQGLVLPAEYRRATRGGRNYFYARLERS